MTLDLTDDEHRALVDLLRHAIDGDLSPPFSPRAVPLKAILDKLEPPALQPGLPPPLGRGLAPSHGGKRRR